MQRFWLLALWLLVHQTAAHAEELKLALIFSDHMVLQCDLPAAVWGTAEVRSAVSVEFAGQKKEATADAEGKWQVQFEPLTASSEPRVVTVRSGDSSLTCQDVLVGEVWQASGQSNMAMTVGDVARSLPIVQTHIEAADFPAIRFRRVNEGESATPLTDLRSADAWRVCTPTAVSGFSAAAYFFARRLQEELRIPVAIIDSSRGGTPIEPYIPREAFAGHPTLQRELELGDQGDLAGLKRLPGGVFARDANWLPGRLFNSRLAPLARFAVRGMIWYQAESNCGIDEDPRDYQFKMQALVNGLRSACRREKLPVYFVQLPGSGASANWTEMRDQQRKSAAIPHTGMVVTVDLEGGDIHPPNKVDVGERLARWALAHEYGKPIPYSGPLFSKAEVKAGQIVVHFNYAETGLMIATKPGLAAPQENREGVLNLFEVCDETGNWTAAEATISGKTVLVHSTKVPHPTAARYAWQITPQGCNLYNKAGLPASPFQTRE